MRHFLSAAILGLYLGLLFALAGFPEASRPILDCDSQQYWDWSYR